MAIVLFISTFLAAIIIYGLWKHILDELKSPIRCFRGPPSYNPLLGNILQILNPDQLNTHRKWIEEYGPTFKYKGLLWRSRLYTSDLKAIHHVLTNNYTYQKPEAATYNLRRILGPGMFLIYDNIYDLFTTRSGPGVLLTEGDVHKSQRKILNPAFGPLQIRELTAIFVEKAIQLRDAWLSKVKAGGGEVRVDALSWMSKATLDVIGEAGFGYDFGALSEQRGQRNELLEAFRSMFKVGTRPSLVAIFRGRFSILRFLPADRDAEGKKARQIMHRIGRQLLEDRKRETKNTSSRANDLLSLLVRANTSTDTLEHQKMSDDDVIAQIPTFIVAGHETTSTATAWALYALTKDKKIQDKLRDELLTISTDNPTMEELNSLPYLDAVVRETLRVYPPITTTMRTAVEDDILPLENPVKDRNGKLHHSIRINKGQVIVIPISLINTSKEVWGESADQFDPSRWNSVPRAATSIPGIWGNMLTFLGGPRACIGYRFSLVEIKALLFTLIRAFDFELAVPHEDIAKKAEIVTRPVLRTDPNNANQLPIIIKHILS